LASNINKTNKSQYYIKRILSKQNIYDYNVLHNSIQNINNIYKLNIINNVYNVSTYYISVSYNYEFISNYYINKNNNQHISSVYYINDTLKIINHEYYIENTRYKVLVINNYIKHIYNQITNIDYKVFYNNYININNVYRIEHGFNIQLV